MWEIIGAIVLLWFTIGFIAELCAPANHNRTKHHAQRKYKDKRNMGWLEWFPLVAVVVLLINPDYGLKK